MQVQTVSTKDSPRKTSKKETSIPKPPKKRFPSGAKKTLSSSGLAKQKEKLKSPKKKPSRAKKLLLTGALALGIAAAPLGAEARAPDPTNLSPPSYTIAPPLGEASSTESLKYLLSSLKAETDKYRKSTSLSLFEIPLLQGAKLRLRVDSMSRSIHFTVLQGAQRHSFKLSFSELNIITPEVRIQDQGETLVVRLLDKMNGRQARITLLKSDVAPEKMLIRVFDESADLHAAQQAFQSLNALPEPVMDPKTTESKLLMGALEAAENLLISQTRDLEFSSSSAEDKRTAFERTVDTFISIYSSLGGEAVDELSSAMEGMDREERGRVMEFAIPRLTAIMMRPFAAWQGSLGGLDRLLSSPDFSTQSLREFAWHNNLHQEYNFLLKGVREHFSS